MDRIKRMLPVRILVYAWLLSCVACSASTGAGGSSSNTGGGGSGGSGGGSDGSGGTGGDISVGVGGFNIPDAGPDDGGGIIETLPAGFLATEVGGYKLGGPTSEGSGGEGGAPGGNVECGNVLVAVVRDFKGRSEAGGHPDFEGPLYGNDITKGLVEPILGADDKPVYASKCEEGNSAPPPTCPFGPETTTKANFDQWYRDTSNVNKPYLLQLWLAPQPGGLFTFQSLSFFPLDDAGWGNSGVDKAGVIRNFSFTTELHTRFQYKGGETFLFEGDDDVWVFINGHLAVDLGGLHPKGSTSVVLDASAEQLGIVKGNVYSLDLFHAERHTPESTFRIDTNLSFVDCGPEVPK
ncbi:fibro-slime domain-containing protein [Polyangium sp. y55x31]|uniref:fibro-slime domain-containing protein n=1 Tax=Polyangium sp. y55x31 TaxID=3042688 RepID=UPI002482A2E7|nr:fibro-slime domain-containing protein [Polyangium sp. y55x31]MDI1479313.1 fibro-slime domain-containing protein [Polyangium sp. y55x31]